VKANASIAQMLYQFDQVVHRATKSIKPPNDKRVALL
jgi:hypothetical protein